ncbi:hypothetical protein RFM41_33280 [Mesorhizobium sp. VK25A]|uniref:Uncharacterized protein n=1 Tax=Mesorhizobium vachelliae TaxID=3072309 RepID=A0ABU5AF24_9HYPH|nr:MULTISPECIES: hypothetical protein [unclassified Mesorhizobium]MDX8535863.1 hypothetical protein [Mesorhizobium sp. VK25D]MDX8548617.1 hypothetical protein [Mesorhizobium sp. VK25A]
MPAGSRFSRARAMLVEVAWTVAKAVKELRNSEKAAAENAERIYELMIPHWPMSAIEDKPRSSC